ncbi:hypothetical protein PanWU01x14_126870 [Parasponia andersonii]|uniref:Transmembrane protein n=1 Tax=Parasponia andersonii TaxID=3476 RepID=A0A2P5CSY6_PARAD|nr:hypothetical protein PanWU01x14_126870 [Parasponia andersonii]
MKGLGLKKSRDGLHINIVKVVLLVIFTNFLLVFPLSSIIPIIYFAVYVIPMFFHFYIPSFFTPLPLSYETENETWIWEGDQEVGVRSLMGDLSFGVVRKHVLRQIVDMP